MLFVDVNKSKLVLCMTGRQMGDGGIAPLIVGRVWIFGGKVLFCFWCGSRLTENVRIICNYESLLSV
jgi:hypothetical protein